jgi:alkanesulfonate monooxygenase SsuD/methylene tetrahydromethanopterin reductase-like flavin-dependent oxidoreductase (luciferase family)
VAADAPAGHDRGVSEQQQAPRIGFTFTPERPIGELPRVAREADQLGFDELWLWEDCFLSGGIAASATALAATERIIVGLGIMPAVFRNVAAAAMDVATLANLAPGRFLAGLGHGMADWMEQIGALPERPVRQLEEYSRALRALLAGDVVTQQGDYVRLRDVQLAFPPAVAPPVLLGVRRPFGLRASGRSADGTILAEPTPPAYIRAARDEIERGRAAAGRTDPHHLVAFVRTRLDADRSQVRRVVAADVLRGATEAHLEPLGRDADLERLRALGDVDAVAAALPADLLDVLTASGDADRVVASLTAIAAAGAHSIVLVPLGDDADRQLRELAGIVLPALRAAARA